MSNQNFETNKKERFGIYSYFFGQNMIYFLQMMFLSIYFINALGIPAIIVGNIILVARIWDAVNDPMLSILVEKTNLKSGKFKPWIKSVSIAMPIVTILVFNFTGVLNDASLTVRIAYASIMYISWGMLYTISDAPAFALITVMTSNQEEKNGIISFARFAAMLGVIFFILLSGIIGENISMVAIVTSVLAFVFLQGINFTKERSVAKDTKTPTLKEIVRTIFGNKFLVAYVVTSVMYGLTAFGMPLMPFVANDLFQNPAVMQILMLLMIGPVVLAAPIMPKLIKRYGKKTLLNVTYGSTIVMGIIMYFAGYSNLPLFIGLSFIKGLLAAPLLVIGSLVYSDIIEYSEYTKGDRFEAATFSAQTFSAKALGALSGGLGTILLGAYGYVEGAGVVQSAETLNGIWVLYNLAPGIGALIALIVLNKFYTLKESDVVEMAAANKAKREKMA